MRLTTLLVAILLVLAGAVFAAQGLGLPFAPRSTMTNDPTWVVIGLGMVLLGAIGIGWARRAERSRRQP